MKFTKTTKNLAMKNKEFREVEAIDSGKGLWIYRRDAECWVINHESGVRIFAVGRLKYAKTAIEQLLKIGDWKRPLDQIQKESQEFRTKLKNIMFITSGV